MSYCHKCQINTLPALWEPELCDIPLTRSTASQVGDKLPDALLAHLGAAEARRVAEYGRRAVQHVAGLIDGHAIPCGLEQAGIVFPAASADRMRKARAMHAAATELGIPAQLWSGPETKARLGSDAFVGAYFDPLGLNFNPFALARGILTRIIDPLQNVTVFENTEVLFVDCTATAGSAGVAAVRATARGIRLLAADISPEHRERHVIRAAYVLQATNSYTHTMAEQRLPRYNRVYAPLHVYTIAT